MGCFLGCWGTPSPLRARGRNAAPLLLCLQGSWALEGRAPTSAAGADQGHHVRRAPELGLPAHTPPGLRLAWAQASPEQDRAGLGWGRGEP